MSIRHLDFKDYGSVFLIYRISPDHNPALRIEVFESLGLEKIIFTLNFLDCFFFDQREAFSLFPVAVGEGWQWQYLAVLVHFCSKFGICVWVSLILGLTFIFNFKIILVNTGQSGRIVLSPCLAGAIWYPHLKRRPISLVWTLLSLLSQNWLSCWLCDI